MGKVVPIPRTWRISMEAREADGRIHRHTMESYGHNIGEAMDDLDNTFPIDQVDKEDVVSLQFTVERV